MSLSCQKHNAIIHEYNSVTIVFTYGAKDKCFTIFRWLCQNQSYEIKLPPQAILGFKILEIFSVEN